MSDDNDEGLRQFAEGIARRFKDAEMPFIYADGHIGIAGSGGVERITLYRQVFNTDIGADKPKVIPAAILAMPTSSLVLLAKQILEGRGYFVGEPHEQAH